jgi:hypothetical protein
MSITEAEGMELGLQFMREPSQARRRSILVLAALGLPGMSLRPADHEPVALGKPPELKRPRHAAAPGSCCIAGCGRRVSPGRMCLACATEQQTA